MRDCTQGVRKAELGEQPLVWLVGEQGVERRGAGRVRAVGLVGGVRVAARNRPRVELPDGVDELGAAAETDLKSIMYSGYGDKTVLHAASSAQYYKHLPRGRVQLLVCDLLIRSPASCTGQLG